MVFNTDTPQQSFTPGKDYSDSPYLSALGFNQDGSRNLWGNISSYIPGVGLAEDAIGSGITQGTDTHDKASSYVAGDFQKLLTESAIAATVLSAGAATPALGATATAGDISAGGAAASGVAGPSFAALSGANIAGNTIATTATDIGSALNSPYVKAGMGLLKQGTQNVSNNPNNQSQNNQKSINTSNYNNY